MEKKLFQVMIERFRENGDFICNDFIFVVADSEKEAKKEAHKRLDKLIANMYSKDYERGPYRFTGSIYEFENAIFSNHTEEEILWLAQAFNKNSELNMLYVTDQEIIIHCDVDRLQYRDLDWKYISERLEDIEDIKGNYLSLNIQRT